MDFRSTKILWDNIFNKNKKSAKMTKLEFLRSVPFFQKLKLKQLDEVSSILHERYYEKDEFIFELGQPGAALFIIQSGDVSIEAPDSYGNYHQIAILKDNSFLGELALLDETPRSASAKAVKRTHAWALFRADLLKLSESKPEIACEIYKILATMIGERLKHTNKLLKSSKPEVAA